MEPIASYLKMLYKAAPIALLALFLAGCGDDNKSENNSQNNNQRPPVVVPPINPYPTVIGSSQTINRLRTQYPCTGGVNRRIPIRARSTNIQNNGGSATTIFGPFSLQSGGTGGRLTAQYAGINIYNHDILIVSRFQNNQFLIEVQACEDQSIGLIQGAQILGVYFPQGITLTADQRCNIGNANAIAAGTGVVFRARNIQPPQGGANNSWYYPSYPTQQEDLADMHFTGVHQVGGQQIQNGQCL